MSEAEFLAKQAADAKAALAATWSDITHSLKGSGDVTLWAKRYPWITTGAAAVAGFVAGIALIPATREEAREKWEHLKSAVSGVGKSDFEAVELDGQRIEVQPESKQSPAAQGIWATLLTQAFSALRPMLMSLVASKFGGKAQPDQDGNGSASTG